MFTLLNDAVDLLRTRHKSGETYNWLLYYAVLSPQQLGNVGGLTLSVEKTLLGKRP